MPRCIPEAQKARPFIPSAVFFTIHHIVSLLALLPAPFSLFPGFACPLYQSRGWTIDNDVDDMLPSTMTSAMAITHPPPNSDLNQPAHPSTTPYYAKRFVRQRQKQNQGRVSAAIVRPLGRLPDRRRNRPHPARVLQRKARSPRAAVRRVPRGVCRLPAAAPPRCPPRCPSRLRSRGVESVVVPVCCGKEEVHCDISSVSANPPPLSSWFCFCYSVVYSRFLCEASGDTHVLRGFGGFCKR